MALGSSVPCATLAALAITDEPRLVRAALLLARSATERYDELRILLLATRAPSPLTATVRGHVEGWLRHTNGRLPRPDHATASELCTLLLHAVELRAVERNELAIRLGCG